MDTSSRPTRHSFSSIKLYQKCPYAYACRYILNLPEETSAAMDRGTRLHKLAEDYLLGNISQCPYDLKKVGMRIFWMQQRKAKPEETWLLDADWKPTDNPKVAKIKAIIDVHYTDNGVLYLHDYKSGRAYPDHADQLELYSLIGLQRYPDAKRVESSAIYIDSGNEGFTRSILPAMFSHYQKRWVEVLRRLDSEEEFGPSAGTHCLRCAYGASKGGPCHAEQR